MSSGQTKGSQSAPLNNTIAVLTAMADLFSCVANRKRDFTLLVYICQNEMGNPKIPPKPNFLQPFGWDALHDFRLTQLDHRCTRGRRLKGVVNKGARFAKRFQWWGTVCAYD